jgi:hypothetical protein
MSVKTSIHLEFMPRSLTRRLEPCAVELAAGDGAGWRRVICPRVQVAACLDGGRVVLRLRDGAAVAFHHQVGAYDTAR